MRSTLFLVHVVFILSVCEKKIKSGSKLSDLKVVVQFHEKKISKVVLCDFTKKKIKIFYFSTEQTRF